MLPGSVLECVRWHDPKPEAKTEVQDDRRKRGSLITFAGIGPFRLTLYSLAKRSTVHYVQSHLNRESLVPEIQPS